MAKTKQGKKKAVTAEDVERVSANNRREWLDALDYADNVANRLDLLSVVLCDSDVLGISDNAVCGLVNMLTEASATIRDLSERVQQAHK